MNIRELHELVKKAKQVQAEVRTERMMKPHGDCIKQPKGNYYYEGDYIVEGCYRSCLNDQIVSACGCYDPRLTEVTTMAGTSCATGSADTIAKNTECIQKEMETFNVVDQCECNQNCEESTHSVTVSTALWPSEVYSPPSCNNYTLTMKYWKEIRNCLDWYSKNTLLIEVYYERMNYQILKQVAEYGIVNLISDTGGQLGLWLGVSFITCVEFSALSMLVVCYMLCAKEKVGDDQDEHGDNSDVEEKGEENKAADEEDDE